MKIAIDPGHGYGNDSRVQPPRFDPGAVWYEGGVLYREADIVLAYSLALRDELARRGVETHLTRVDNQRQAALKWRVGGAVVARCTALVSVHVNSAEADEAHGVETLYSRWRDVLFARRMQRALVQATGLRDRGVKSRPDLAILQFPGPCVLLELGFIRNDRDRETILSPLTRAEVCARVADVFTGERIATPLEAIDG
jgi:N-acetylmuramoyl-L-alanine amidase